MLAFGVPGPGTIKAVAATASADTNADAIPRRIEASNDKKTRTLIPKDLSTLNDHISHVRKRRMRAWPLLGSVSDPGHIVRRTGREWDAGFRSLSRRR